MIVDLHDPAALDPRLVGSKAAHLAAAAATGLPVPAGFVIPVGTAEDPPSDPSPDLTKNPTPDTAHDAARDAGPDAAYDTEVVVAADRLGGLLAVRSSALAEDLPDASYAGLYESVLQVRAADVPAAVRRVRASGDSSRAIAYRGRSAQTGIAVLVQAMVPAAAAGVAFTANPVTGARDETHISAVAGLGESLVSGEAVGEQWLVRGRVADLTRPAGVLDASQALVVARLAARVADLFGCPQDIEWAIADGRVTLLQARPMTALPEPVTWIAPGRGLWVSNFRIGEWLPEPVTPLFGDWILPLLDDGFRQGMRETAGASVPFGYALVNGWYYARPTPTARHLPAAILRSRGRLLRFMVNALVRPGRDPAGAAVALLDGLYHTWRDQLLPDYAALAGTDTADLSAGELIRLVEDVAHTAGRHLWYLAVVGGAAWKMEESLRRLLARAGLGHVQVPVLLRGLHAPAAPESEHAVFSLDWYHPTGTPAAPAAGDAADAGGAADAGDAEDPANGGDAVDVGRVDRWSRLRDQRVTLENTCQRALTGRPRLLRRWTAMLQTAQRYAQIRDEQATQLTLGWPLMRTSVGQLAQSLIDAGLIEAADDIYFLTRDELTEQRPLGSTARQRRDGWMRARRLTPPLALGSPPPLIGRRLERTVGVNQRDRHEAVLTGQPASPGHATGPARIVRSPDDFTRVQPGDVLIARATAPAWTPLFDRVVAVVTDGGTVAAHASLLAREYGIPAVVATGDATSRVRDGQILAVDGGQGVVRLHPSRRQAATSR